MSARRDSGSIFGDLRGQIWTGWFGVPGGPVSRGKIHLVRAETKRPVCGATIGELSQFQFCAARAFMHFVDCQHCQRWAAS